METHHSIYLALYHTKSDAQILLRLSPESYRTLIGACITSHVYRERKRNALIPHKSAKDWRAKAEDAALLCWWRWAWNRCRGLWCWLWARSGWWWNGKRHCGLIAAVFWWVAVWFLSWSANLFCKLTNIIAWWVVRAGNKVTIWASFEGTTNLQCVLPHHLRKVPCCLGKSGYASWWILRFLVHPQIHCLFTRQTRSYGKILPVLSVAMREYACIDDLLRILCQRL